MIATLFDGPELLRRGPSSPALRAWTFGQLPRLGRPPGRRGCRHHSGEQARRHLPAGRRQCGVRARAPEWRIGSQDDDLRSRRLAVGFRFGGCTVSASFQRAQKLVSSLAPRETGCLETEPTRRTSRSRARDLPARRSRSRAIRGDRDVVGRLYVADGADYVTVTGLDLDARTRPACRPRRSTLTT